MAFRAPTNHRQLSIQSVPPLQDDDLYAEASYSPLLSSPGIHSPTVEQDADEWVVFSRSSVGDAATVTETNPLSQVSEIGSVQSAPRILRHGGNYGIPGAFDDLVGDEEEDEEDDEDDDSLGGTETDSLQPFREQDNEGPVMLPTHDGLGTFPSSSGVISGLRSLEESLRIAAMAGHTQAEEDTDAKIQRWRVEHSQALLDEIQRMTRRRMSLASLRGGNLEGKDRNLLDEGSAFMDIGNSSAEDLTTSASTPTQNHTESMEKETEEHSETLWKRITRRFICDIMGIDDELLQVIFGEALPTEALADFSHEGNQASKEVEERLLNRLARELGVLVNHYTSHPAGEGAFSTHRGNFGEYDDDDGVQTPQPLPTLREQEQDEYTASPRRRQRSQSATRSENSSVPQFQFAPTLSHQEEISHAALWGIEEHEVDEETQAKRNSQMRKEYWEQELGVRVFFSFLKSRFSGPKSDTSSGPPPSAPIHQSHPLINRNPRPAFNQYQNLPRRSSSSNSASKMVSSPTASASTGQLFGGFEFGIRSVSSYASQSTKGKGNGKKTLSSRGSSRNRGFYWDVATSVGSGKTGSCIGTAVWAAI